jgi:hypothetical protein
VPKIAGPTALEAAKAFLASVEQGKVARSTLGDDFNALLTDEHLAKDRASLAANGKVTDVAVRQTVERGGMEVAIVEYKVGKTLRERPYRSPTEDSAVLINRQCWWTEGSSTRVCGGSVRRLDARPFPTERSRWLAGAYRAGSWIEPVEWVRRAPVALPAAARRSRARRRAAP